MTYTCRSEMVDMAQLFSRKRDHKHALTWVEEGGTFAARAHPSVSRDTTLSCRDTHKRQGVGILPILPIL
jgi:hypothetical protein